MKYKTILADPPWEMTLSRMRSKRLSLPYPTMSLAEICDLPVGDLAADDCHLWLWTTNQVLPKAFDVVAAWGFKYLAPVHWIKPSGLGNWFVHRTQTILFCYRGKLRFNNERYRPNIFMTGNPPRHSQKPDEAFDLIESISDGPRVELFARRRRPGWSAWGNEVKSDVCLV